MNYRQNRVTISIYNIPMMFKNIHKNYTYSLGKNKIKLYSWVLYFKIKYNTTNRNWSTAYWNLNSTYYRELTLQLQTVKFLRLTVISILSHNHEGMMSYVNCLASYSSFLFALQRINSWACVVWWYSRQEEVCNYWS